MRRARSTKAQLVLHCLCCQRCCIRPARPVHADVDASEGWRGRARSVALCDTAQATRQGDCQATRNTWPVPSPPFHSPACAPQARFTVQSQTLAWAVDAAASWHSLGALAASTSSRKSHCADLPARRADADADVKDGWRRNLRLRRGSELACSGRARGARKRPHLRELAGDQAPADTVIDALPVDLLVHVFCLLDQRALRFVLPLVCRHWCAALWYLFLIGL